MNIDQAKSWLLTQSQAIKELDFWSSLSEDQFIALAIIGSGIYDCTTILGRAGSGKTYVVRAAKQLLTAQGHEVKVSASTGVAAKNAEGEGTLNKIAGLKASGSTIPLGLRDLCEGHWIRSSTPFRAQTIASNFDQREKRDLVVFIDEVSMLSSEDLVLAYEVLERCCPNRRLRFVLVGDFRQLLSVQKQEQLPWQVFQSLPFEPAKFHQAGTPKDDIRIYGSMLCDGEGPFEKGSKKPWRATTLSLITNHRQKDHWFVEALNALGDGNDFNHPVVSTLLSRVWIKEKGQYINLRTRKSLDVSSLKEAIHLFNTNKEVVSHNEKLLEKAIEEGAEVRSYEADLYVPGQDAAEARERILREVSPLTEKMTLAVGLKFMIRININKTLTNGTVGVIRELTKNDIRIELSDGSLHWVTPMEIPVPTGKHGRPIGRFEALPGVLCHAMTPWKIQGLTIREPLVYHARNIQEHGLLYVVCSRVSNPKNLFILCKNAMALNALVTCNPKIKDFIKRSEMVMHKALGRYPEFWSDAGNNKVWVREHAVAVQPDIQSGVLLTQTGISEIYCVNNSLIMRVLDKEKLAEVLLKDDEAFLWFVKEISAVVITDAN